MFALHDTGLSHLPRTSAACAVRPPRAVTMPAATANPATSSVEVSGRTRMTASPVPTPDIGTAGIERRAPGRDAADAPVPRPIGTPGGRPDARNGVEIDVGELPQRIAGRDSSLRARDRSRCRSAASGCAWPIASAGPEPTVFDRELTSCMSPNSRSMRWSRSPQIGAT